MAPAVVIDEECGAKTTLYPALSEGVAATSAKYFDENQIAQPAAEAANGVLLQDALWEVSERWVRQ